MYEKYTRQALPKKDYRELLGSAICVFNSNNAFIVENILHIAPNYNWYKLIKIESGKLRPKIKKTITKNSDNSIANQFDRVTYMRNRIVHSFQITTENGEQLLATIDKDTDMQFPITRDYLLNFIKENEKLTDMLYAFRRDAVGN